MILERDENYYAVLSLISAFRVKGNCIYLYKFIQNKTFKNHSFL
jgi:hypothetical protein